MREGSVCCRVDIVNGAQRTCVTPNAEPGVLTSSSPGRGSACSSLRGRHLPHEVAVFAFDRVHRSASLATSGGSEKLPERVGTIAEVCLAPSCERERVPEQDRIA